MSELVQPSNLPGHAPAPQTGDTLAKQENITAPAQPAGNYFGTSIIAQMPKAVAVNLGNSPASGANENDAVNGVAAGDYDDAMETLVLTMAEHFLTVADVMAHSKVRHALSIIEGINESKKHPIATGTGVPVNESVNVKVDADPIPFTSTTTKNPTIQPVDPSVPASAPNANDFPAAPVQDTVAVASTGPVADAPAANDDNSAVSADPDRDKVSQ